MFGQFIKFSGVGVIGTTVHYTMLIFLVKICSTNAVAASSVGALLGALVNYYLNHRYTFNSTRKHKEAMWRFYSVSTGGFALNGIMMAFLTEFLTVFYLAAQILTTGVVLFWNYLFSRFWAFSEGERV